MTFGRQIPSGAPGMTAARSGQRESVSSGLMRTQSFWRVRSVAT